MKELERRVEEMEIGGGVRGQKGKKKVREGGGLERRMKLMEGMLERKKRENRRRNIVIRRLEIKEGKRKEEIEKVLDEMGMKEEVEEIRRMGSKGGERGEMVVVKLAKEEQKREIMRRRGMLKGRKKWITENWTWRERRMK